MHKIILTLSAILTLNFAACAQSNSETSGQSPKQPLVVYFSVTGNTEKAARSIAEITGGTLCEIVPRQSYTSADINWRNRQSRSSVEMSNPDSRPALQETTPEVGDYDVVFIGYPIWWNQAPRIINTFIESHDLKGKVLVPFATSGSSEITNSVRELKSTYPHLDWQNGKLLNRSSRPDIQNWVNGVLNSL